MGSQESGGGAGRSGVHRAGDEERWCFHSGTKLIDSRRLRDLSGQLLGPVSLQAWR